MHAPKVLAPVQRNDGASHFRIETPAARIDPAELNIEFLHLGSKYSQFPFRTGFQPVDKLTGTLWDRRKLVERQKVPRLQGRYDATWLSRSLLSFANDADNNMRRLIYDVDDAVWLGEGAHCFEHHCKSAVVVLAGNKFLSDKASAFSSRVELTPTSVDVERYRATGQQSRQFRIGWIGSASGFLYLRDIQRQLHSFLQRRNDATLVVMAERFPRELDMLEKYIEYVPWSLEKDVEVINSFSVGLMPLRDTDWDRGKCSLKMLQYMACGVPCLVSPIGNNLEVLRHETEHGIFGVAVKSDWDEVLNTYYLQPDSHRRTEGLHGRCVVEQHYSTQAVAPRISAAIRNNL